MVSKTLLALVSLSLTVFVNAQALEVGDAVTPVSETVVVEDEFGTEWITVPGVEETTPRRRQATAGTPCKKLEVRKEWRDLNPAKKRKYIEAVQCLMASPSFNSSLPAKMTRYDDFVMAHAGVADFVHGVAQFMPWHRHFNYLYHQAMKDICDYKGPFVYWDWTRDTSGTAPIADSPLFAVDAFGGGGAPGTYTLPNFPPDGAIHQLFPDAFIGPNAGCISNGPFQGAVVHYGPNPRFSDHCIVRNFLEDVRPVLSQANVDRVMSQTNYDAFWNSLDGLPYKPVPELHDGGHGFLRGDMASYYTSNNDPVFYPHHAGIDRLWWKWQAADLANRLNQVQGQTSPYPPHGAITLNTVIPFTGFAPDVSVASTMDPRNEPYCYTY